MSNIAAHFLDATYFFANDFSKFKNLAGPFNPRARNPTG
jgi:hypothetical protein